MNNFHKYSEQDLILITEEGYNVIIDLRYASTDNVCGIKLYKKSLCLLHKDAANALKKAVEIASKLNLRFKIFDAFRPIEVQEYMYNQFQNEYVSDPTSGSVPHCRGIALDLTLIDENNIELDMGTKFDDFSEISWHSCLDLPKHILQNRMTLLGIMTLAGFDFYSQEWWHYQLFKPREFTIIKNNSDLINI